MKPTAGVYLSHQISDLSEACEYHREILLEYKCVTVCRSMRIIDGLHENDFIMAAKASKLSENFNWAQPQIAAVN